MATERAWDPDRPGCAFEECGGMSLDPCVTIVRTRGRWHDGQVPETAAEVVAALLDSHLWPGGTVLVQCRCGASFPGDPNPMECWRMHIGVLAAAAVADWLRAKEGTRDNRAADLLNPGRS
jgi:hypothetical protein